MKVLFVCSANLQRSPTAEELLSGKDGFEVESAGTWGHGQRRVSQDVLEWADRIFVMEERHKEVLLDMDPGVGKKIVVLNIPDRYYKNDPELVETLKSKLSKHLNIKW